MGTGGGGQDSAGDDLDVVVMERNGETLVAVRGELDMSTCPQLAETLGALIDAGARRVALDLQDVAFMDSQGLRVIATTGHRLRELGGAIVLVGPNPQVLALLELTGFTKQFSVEQPGRDR